MNLTTREWFTNLSSQEKINCLKEELVSAFPANSVVYDLNEILVQYPGFEALVWNAAMLLVEEKKLGLIQTKVFNQIRWLMTYQGCLVINSDKFHCPLAKNKKGKQSD